VNASDAAALTSWTINPAACTFLLFVTFIYLRGWFRGRALVRGERDLSRLTSFLAGVLLLFIATESPIDAFDHFYLTAHMTQHLLLMMIIPPLILIGHPMLPLLRGLPKQFVKEGLGPFLAWPPLSRGLSFLVSPPVAWTLFAGSVIFWHLPWTYEAALRSEAVHALQHASFFWTGILFWWSIVRPAPGKSHWPEWAAIPYLLAADLVNTGLSALFVFSGRVLYPSYAAIRASGMSARDDQTLAGLIMWVPGSLIYLVPAFVIAMRVLSGPRLRKPAERFTRVMRQSKTNSWIVVFARYRWVAQAAMLLLAIAVMIDGFVGTQIAPLNMAGVLPWIHWRAFSVVALLLAGNLFCMACPFTFVRDICRRVLPANRRWPAALRNKWLAAGLIVSYLCAYEVFGLWNSPWLTGWIIAGYFLAALLVDGVFRGASFCKYVCPIGQFHFINSLVSPREVRVRDQQTCKSCHTYDCIRGNEQTRGCELYLFQPKKESNLDCTLCLDCVKACPSQNVALLPVARAATLLNDGYRSSIGRLSHRTDLAALALVIVFGGFVNAAAMTGPVMMWEHALHARLGVGAMPWIVAALIATGAVLVPLLVSAAGALLSSKDLVHRLSFALVPLGFAMWLAHLLFHLAGPILSAQILILDGGLLLTLYAGWRIVEQYSKRWSALTGFATVACGLYAAGIWIVLQPMQMRGMM
jgi:cytochrome c oxidase assembly factor CtaG/ferredoxin